MPAHQSERDQWSEQQTGSDHEEFDQAEKSTSDEREHPEEDRCPRGACRHDQRPEGAATDATISLITSVASRPFDEASWRNKTR